MSKKKGSKVKDQAEICGNAGEDEECLTILKERTHTLILKKDFTTPETRKATMALDKQEFGKQLLEVSNRNEMDRKNEMGSLTGIGLCDPFMTKKSLKDAVE